MTVQTAPISRRATQEELRRRALRVLEFEKVRERLAGYASFALSREYALALEPAYAHQEVVRLLDEARDAIALLAQRPNLALDNAKDIRPLVKTAGLGGVLTGAELLEIASTLAVVHSVAANLLRLSTATPSLAGIASDLGDFREIEQHIRQTLNAQGDVVDSASELLGRLRQEARDAEARLHARLQEFVASPEGRKLLQEPYITMRGDRFVLAVKAENRGRVPGLIHDISSSGATVFMEPLSAVEAGNAWRELKLAEKRELDRILRELAALVGEQREKIEASVEALARIDLALAKARMAHAQRAVIPRLVRPEAGKEDVSVDWREARHPLLQGNVVPISVVLRRDGPSALVISGPNTGGKTVTLKSIGLLALMAQAGLPIPAEQGTALRVCDGIYADIGDEQSIEQSLSTFSSHLRNIVDILGVATERSLVLLDELGAGTDPQEGAAVAKAVLADLVRRGSTVVVTTHHGDLKTFAHSTPGVQNANVEFDTVTLAPTYRLVVGLPGRSNALAIAERLGLPRSVLSEAKSDLGPQQAESEALLAEIQEQRRLAAAEHAEAQRAKLELEQAKATLEVRLRRMEEEQRRWLAVHKVEVQVQAEEMKSKLRIAARRVNSLVGDKGREELGVITREVDSIRKQLEKGPWKVELANVQKELLRPGELVRIQGMASPAEVMSAPDQHQVMRVQAGSARISLHRDKIEGKERRKPQVQEKKVVVAPSVMARATVGDELWVHGMRAQQAVEAVDEYLEKAALAGHHTIRIIHGKGKGILRSAIHRALGDHPLVGMWRLGELGEGGDGVTIVEL